MTTIYDGEHDEMIDDKTGEPIRTVVGDVLRDMKFHLASDIMALNALNTPDNYQSLKDRLDVIETMLKGMKEHGL